jgi:hypothetical protein
VQKWHDESVTGVDKRSCAPLVGYEQLANELEGVECCLLSFVLKTSGCGQLSHSLSTSPYQLLCLFICSQRAL